MVHQSRYAFWRGLWLGGINTMRHLPVHVLDTLWFLQPAFAVLDSRAMHATVATGANAFGILLQGLQAVQARSRRPPGMVSPAHRLTSLAFQQDGFCCELRLVYPWHSLVDELNALSQMPWSLQAVFGSHIYSSCQVAHDTHRLLPLLSATLPGSPSAKASRRVATPHRLDANREILCRGLRHKRRNQLRSLSQRV